ncbi:hypothetical protein GALMADRAFT_132579 [Galerina marginata CBS 339.88]|uniref:Uncharacterized protein n=1 Tax=Galerina marginata (strain CBS 339.88) TaxID=685588 RepID=A0A067U3I2_GALM3|nr:hypothetical protein GALMADRAFT_132579 [Galerina marginata CBS 339.88]
MSTDHLESAEFRLHIRSLLYEYSISHYTTNYVTFTEDLVSEFLEGLKPVPLTDPYSFVISVDPIQKLFERYSLSTLQPYDENAETSTEAISYIKNVMRSTQGPSKTDRLIFTDETSYEPLPEPFIPALTRAARKQTPKLGKKTKPILSESYQELLQSQKMSPIHVEPIEEEKLIPEEILQLKLNINPDELPAVKVILQSTIDMMRPQKPYKNKYLDPAFLCGEHSTTYELPEEVFMPIFPRSRLPGSGTRGSVSHLPGLKSLADLPSVVMNKIDGQSSDPDISMQNLVTVDGWETIRSSPPSTPSAWNSDSEGQLDQLFIASSPITEPPLVEEIAKSKMEEVLIPRSRKIGGSSGITPHILAGKTLQSFLQPLLCPLKPEINQAPVANPQPQRSSPTPSSLAGQPASELEDKDSIVNMALLKEDPQNQDLDSELKALYQVPGLPDLMNEMLDAKQDMLWEVPQLQGPNIHLPNGLHVPKAFVDFLIPPATGNDKKTRNNYINSIKPAHQFLKKAKGRQSLGLELSWIPFTVDKRLPSVVELVGVAELFDDHAYGDGICDDHSALVATEKFLKSLDLNSGLDATNSLEVVAERSYSLTEETSSLYCPPDLSDDFKIVLNRQERRRLAKLENRLDPEDDDVDCPADNINATEQFSATIAHEEQQDLEQTSGVPDDERVEDERPVKRPRLESHGVVFDAVRIEEHRPHRPAIDELAPSHDDDGFGPKSSGFFLSPDEEKENWPPLSSSSGFMDELDEDPYEQSWSAGYQDHPMHLQPAYEGSLTNDNYNDFDQDMDINAGGGSFELLSFDSRYPASGAAQNSRTLNYTQERQVPMVAEAEDFSMQILGDDMHMEDVDTNAREIVVPLTHISLAYEPEIASHALGISAFAQLRSRKISESKPIPMPEQPPALPIPGPAARPDDEPRGAPQAIFDQDTLVLPQTTFSIARQIHRYMASLDLIQKHGLVRHLRSEECSVELVERQTLGGVDLILDPSCAVVFLSVFTLPARCDAYVERVSQQSWKFSHLLVVFEAYPEHFARKSTKPRNASELYAYTPPIVKAVKKFRRNVSIAEACGTKRVGTKVQYAFADSVQEAALLTRWYGDLAEERDVTSGLVWGEREWLGADFLEDEEQCLASINSMNHFTASMILSQQTLQDFIDLLPEERLEMCSGLIGDDALSQCNADIENRCQAMAISSDLS